MPFGCLFFGGTGDITGRVIDGNGDGLAGVTISTDPETKTTTTDTNGQYILTEIARGDYTVIASSGSNTVSVLVMVRRPDTFSFKSDVVANNISFGEEPPGEEPQTEIQWYYTYAEGLAAAQESGKPMMIDFYADWCGWCDTLDENTYTDSLVIAKSIEFVCVKIDYDVETNVVNNYGITAVPTIVFTTSTETEVHRVVGYEPPSTFLTEMNTALGLM